MELVNSESRVMLLYSTREEAIHILSQARDYKITGENYVWVVTQSVIGDVQAPGEFPVGMLGERLTQTCCILIKNIVQLITSSGGVASGTIFFPVFYETAIFLYLGVHFDTSSQSLVNEITTAIKVYAYGVEDFVNDPKNTDKSLNTQLSCGKQLGDGRWKTGDRFFKYGPLSTLSIQQMLKTIKLN